VATNWTDEEAAQKPLLPDGETETAPPLAGEAAFVMGCSVRKEAVTVAG
jgi:hypothetical protein